MAGVFIPEKSLKNSRFEAFLKRMLPEEEFRAIRAYSPCVVQSSTEKLVFRHVVLTDNKIYLTEHPPRTVYPITMISDVTDIKTVNEQPWFLSGKDQETCQHIKITCNSSRPHKKSWRRRKATSEQNLSTSHNHLSQSGSELQTPSLKSATSSLDLESKSIILEDQTPGWTSRLSRIRNLELFRSNAGSPVTTYSPIGTFSFFPQSFTPIDTWSISTSRLSNGRISSCSVRSLPATTEMFNNPGEMKMKLVEEINLYILNSSSNFVSKIYLIWDDCLINSTLMSSSDNLSPNLLSQPKNDKMVKLFKELSEEIFENEENVEEFYKLLQELLSSLRKYPIVKTLFWKNSLMIKLLISNLEKYLMGTNSEQDVLNSREDELEFVVLILNILNLSFEDQDNAALRKLHLTANSNKYINNTIQLSLTFPRIPNKYMNTTKRMLNIHSEYSSGIWKNLPECELIDLMATLTNKQLVLLSEIIKQEILSAKDITLAIENNVDQFIPRFMTQFLTLLTTPDYMKPTEVTLLYRHLHFLKFINENSEKLKKTIANDYNEEFKYFVNSGLVLDKIGNNCPLKILIEKLFHDVIN